MMPTHVWDNWKKPGYAMFAVTNDLHNAGAKITLANGDYVNAPETHVEFYRGIIYVPFSIKTVLINVYCQSLGIFYHFGHNVQKEYENQPRILYIHLNSYCGGTAKTIPSALKLVPEDSIPQIAYVQAIADSKADGYYPNKHADCYMPTIVTHEINPEDLTPFEIYVYNPEPEPKPKPKTNDYTKQNTDTKTGNGVMRIKSSFL
jgi:hypothetical protein